MRYFQMNAKEVAIFGTLWRWRSSDVNAETLAGEMRKINSKWDVKGDQEWLGGGSCEQVYSRNCIWKN